MKVQGIDNNKNQYKQNFGMIKVSGKGCTEKSFGLVKAFFAEALDLDVFKKGNSVIINSPFGSATEAEALVDAQLIYNKAHYKIKNILGLKN